MWHINRKEKRNKLIRARKDWGIKTHLTRRLMQNMVKLTEVPL